MPYPFISVSQKKKITPDLRLGLERLRRRQYEAR